MRMFDEWSRWEASDMDRKAERPSERERTSQHERTNGRGWVDNQQDCPEGELRGLRSVKITEHERASGRARVNNRQDCPEGEL